MPGEVVPSQVVPGQVVTVEAGSGRALREALAARLADRGPQPCAVVIASGDASDKASDVPEQALVDLLCGPLGIGAVAPLLYDEHDRVAEGGTFAGPGGTVAPFNTGAALSAPEHAFRRDVPGTSSAVVAVSASALEGLSFGERGTEADLTVRDVLDHVRARGFRIVYEPSWRVPAPSGFSPGPATAGPRRWADRDESAPTRVLVVTGTVPGTLMGAEGLVEVVESLARCPSVRITLACADGFEAGRLGAYYRRQGVEVVAAPVDWPLWCHERRYHYSHVIAGEEGLTTRLWSLVQATQPQAMRVLYCDRLPFRRYEALGEATSHTEGTETVSEVLHTKLLRQLDGIDAAWCASGATRGCWRGLPRNCMWRVSAPRSRGRKS